MAQTAQQPAGCYTVYMTTLRQFKKSQTVFYQGETPTSSFRIKKGLVRAYIIHENGEEATIAFFGPGDIFPIAAPFAIAPVTMFYYETGLTRYARVTGKRSFSTSLSATPVRSYAVLRSATPEHCCMLHPSRKTAHTTKLPIRYAI